MVFYTLRQHRQYLLQTLQVWLQQVKLQKAAFVHLVQGHNFSNLYINLSGVEYASLAEAQVAGAATINYGLFINSLIEFLIVAVATFFLVRGSIAIHAELTKSDDPEPEAPTTHSCPFCVSEISVNARRCPYCTSTLEPV